MFVGGKKYEQLKKKKNGNWNAQSLFKILNESNTHSPMGLNDDVVI